MSQWYVKELSKLTNVSVQTLHHYDRIGLLKPSVRLSNGYRLYSENDLLKLQQIIALKFFGFELNQIKSLLDADIDVLSHFAKQAEFLEEKSKNLLQASQALKSIIHEYETNKIIPWEGIIKTIEVYRVAETLEDKWATKILTNSELEEFVSLVQKRKSKLSEAEQKATINEWNDIVKQVEDNLQNDPHSKIGIEIGRRFVIWVNTVYAHHISLRNAIWEKGFKSGQNIDPDLSQEGVLWLDKAGDAYYEYRINNILSKIGRENDAIIKEELQVLLSDMCGNNEVERNKVKNNIIKIKTNIPSIKKWLQQHLK